MSKKLTKIYKKAKKIYVDDNTKIVIMSDCHRGAGDDFDNFSKNQNIYKKALKYYFDKGFTYIELGDGDEMWEVTNYKDIIKEHLEVFKILKKFHQTNRLFMIYGNHDILKKYSNILENNFYNYYDENNKKEEKLLDDLIIYEALILNYFNKEIILFHGHQIDFLNSTLWRFSRFLVRHLWKAFERFGIKDPTNVAKNYFVTKKTEKKLKKWSIKNNKIVIAGHTHRPIYPKIGDGLYFNDGSCIYANGITAIEIEQGRISLVIWEFEINKKGIVVIKRKVIEGNEKILNFFNISK